MVETRLLHYFLTVARERNITNAAKVLHITQPTLSRQMTLLEEQLGVKLFVRDSRPLALTDEGFLLRRRAEEILELVEKTEAEVSAQEEQVEGSVSIGCGELASTKLLMEMVAGFSEQFPRVTFDVYTANADRIKHRMDNGLTDVGLLLEPVEMERYEFIRMPVRERWVAMMPSGVPLARRKYVTARDLDDIPVIMISSEDSENIICRAYEMGVSDYINRPFDTQVVYRRVYNTIKLYAKQRRLIQLVTDQVYEK